MYVEKCQDILNVRIFVITLMYLCKNIIICKLYVLINVFRSWYLTNPLNNNLLS